MAASYDDGSVLRRRQRTQRRQRRTTTAGDGSGTKKDYGLYWRKTTAAADIDDDAIGGSISLVRGLKQQSNDDRGEETATAIQRPMGDGVVAWDRRCIRGRGRDKRAHRDTSTEPRCESGGLHHNENMIYIPTQKPQAQGGVCFFDFHAPP